eukprot:1153940-Pelagomonas_calceolata.AAC.4
MNLEPLLAPTVATTILSPAPTRKSLILSTPGTYTFLQPGTQLQGFILTITTQLGYKAWLRLYQKLTGSCAV